MELLLGSHVREHGNRVGRLAGFELEPGTFRIHRVIFSADGDSSTQPSMRPFAAVGLVHDDGEIELRPYSDEAGATVADAILLGRATRLRQAGRDAGRLVGLEIDPAERRILSVFSRHHWWGRRQTHAAERLDLSTPGEIRVNPPPARAA